MRFHEEQMEASRNFANKIWNASRFIMMNLEKAIAPGQLNLTALTDADRWILSKVNQVTVDVSENMDKFEMGMAVQKVHDFIWEEFCDWYIEMVKPRLYNETDTTKAAALWTLKTVLTQALKLLHPFMPFVTEEIYCTLNPQEESIMIAPWPVYQEEWNFTAQEQAVELMKEAVRNIRGVRTEMNVPPSKKATVYIVSKEESVRAIFENGKVFFATLGYASEVCIQEDKTGIAADAVSTVLPQAVIYIPFAELVDMEKEVRRLEKEAERLKKELNRVEGMLGNEKFLRKAPEAKIQEEKEKMSKYTQMMEQVNVRLEQLRNS
jgi:valyl-tRNA synthetase